MAEILIISKAVSPPFSDGSVVFVRDLASTPVPGHTLRVMVPSGGTVDGPATAEAVYARPSRFSPSLLDNARVAKRLGRVRDGIAIDHYVFAPNARTSAMGFAMKRLRRRPVVHTVPSRPSERAPLFADVHVALSDDTAALLRDWGARDVRVIRPGFVPPKPSAPNRAAFGLPAGKRVVLFAGDMTESGGAETVAAALERLPDVHAAFAYRSKSPEHEETLQKVTARLGTRAILLGEVDDMPSLIASVDLQCLPASNLTGKVDFPYVILESMALGTPVALGDMAPLNEIGDEGQGVARVSYSPRELSRQLDKLLGNPDRLTALAEAARTTVARQFSPETAAAQYASLYDELS